VNQNQNQHRIQDPVHDRQEGCRHIAALQQLPPPSLAELGRALIHLPHPVVIHRHTLLWVNEATVKLVAASSADDLIGRDSLEFVAPEHREFARQRQLSLFRDGYLLGTSELRILRLDGSDMMGEAMAALMDWEGQPAACMVLWDITDRYKKAEHLRWESTHDVLTQLLNRRGVLDELTRTLAVAPTEAAGVGVIIADLDRFKEVNDTLGHRCGDRVLIEMAEQLQKLAGNHLVGRFGGDEFLVCLPGASRAEVDSLTQAMADIVVTLRHEEQLTVSPSVGGAWCRSLDLDIDALVAAADHAMYRAKRDHLGWLVEETSAAQAAADSTQRPFPEPD